MKPNTNIFVGATYFKSRSHAPYKLILMAPIVYSNSKNETNSVDTQEEAYKAFFDDLDKAVDALILI